LEIISTIFFVVTLSKYSITSEILSGALFSLVFISGRDSSNSSKKLLQEGNSGSLVVYSTLYTPSPRFTIPIDNSAYTTKQLNNFETLQSKYTLVNKT
jgi:hypothetical protein